MATYQLECSLKSWKYTVYYNPEKNKTSRSIKIYTSAEIEPYQSERVEILLTEASDLPADGVIKKPLGMQENDWVVPIYIECDTYFMNELFLSLTKTKETELDAPVMTIFGDIPQIAQFQWDYKQDLKVRVWSIEYGTYKPED